METKKTVTIRAIHRLNDRPCKNKVQNIADQLAIILYGTKMFNTSTVCENRSQPSRGEDSNFRIKKNALSDKSLVVEIPREIYNDEESNLILRTILSSVNHAKSQGIDVNVSYL